VRLLSLAEARYNEGGGKAEIDAEAYAAQVLQLWAACLDGADMRLFFVFTCVTPSNSPFASVLLHF
jgi:beta-xylosidase